VKNVPPHHMSNITVIWRAIGLMSRREAYATFGLLLLMLVAGMLESTVVAAVLPFVYVLVDPASAAANPKIAEVLNLLSLDEGNALPVLSVTLVATLILASLTSALVNYLNERQTELSRLRLARAILERIVNAPYLWMIRRDSSTLVKAIYDDVRIWRRDCLQSLLNLVQAVILIIFPAVAATLLAPMSGLLALKRGIPVLLPFGYFGVLHMTLMKEPQDLFSFYDRPNRNEMKALPLKRAEAMRTIGRRYLEGRFGGRADDLASVYAYQRNATQIDRESLCRQFGWDPAKPIVGFYASNWYDWPHQLGMTQFRDFLDWTMETFRIAGETSQFNWLFKPHPCEEWFGGVSLTEILSQMPGASHVRLAEKVWNNTSVMQCMDALTTYHGTAGIEFASLGKPVLVPDRGKYDDCGFVRVAANRAEYLSLLRSSWWDELDSEDVRARAELFAGWWFCAPSWQGNFLLADDSRQDELYGIIQRLLRDNPGVVGREIVSLRDWLASGHRYSHTFKMMQVDEFQLTNV